MTTELPDYPVVVIHLIDPPGSGLAACCGLPWKKHPVERQGTTLWACTGCFRWAARPGSAAIEAEAVAAERERIKAAVLASDWLSSTILRIIEGETDD